MNVQQVQRPLVFSPRQSVRHNVSSFFFFDETVERRGRATSIWKWAILPLTSSRVGGITAVSPFSPDGDIIESYVSSTSSKLPRQQDDSFPILFRSPSFPHLVCKTRCWWQWFAIRFLLQWRTFYFIFLTQIRHQSMINSILPPETVLYFHFQLYLPIKKTWRAVPCAANRDDRIQTKDKVKRLKIEEEDPDIENLRTTAIL